MELSALYDIAAKQDIPVLSFPLEKTGSLSHMDDRGRCFIGMDPRLRDGAVQERVHLSHELGHCVTGSFYNRYAAVDHRRRHENRADKWAIRKLLTVDQLDDAIAEDIRDFVARKGRNIPVYQCSEQGVKITHVDTMETEEHRIYQPDVLATQTLDRMAMTVNQYYQGQYSKGALADWMECDYFSRMSNRAYADFQEAVLRAAGRTEADALAGNWEFSDAQLENLGKMEHARWNAFHFCMGFVPMSQEEYAERTAIYRQQQQETGKGKIRIGKNLEAGTHACLIGWDALDVLSDTENAITGGNVDYKQMDKNNILLLPELLRIRDGKNG